MPPLDATTHAELTVATACVVDQLQGKDIRAKCDTVLAFVLAWLEQVEQVSCPTTP